MGCDEDEVLRDMAVTAAMDIGLAEDEAESAWDDFLYELGF